MKANLLKIVSQLLSQISVKELSNSKIKQVLSLGDALDEKIKRSVEMQHKILQSYDVEVKDGNYVWLGHKDEKTITAKIDEVLEEDLTEELSSYLNFMTEDEFINATKGTLETSQMRFMKEYLVQLK